jgi:hypothetical protein
MIICPIRVEAGVEIEFSRREELADLFVLDGGDALID